MFRMIKRGPLDETDVLCSNGHVNNKMECCIDSTSNTAYMATKQKLRELQLLSLL